jgi:hypothetical protein
MSFKETMDVYVTNHAKERVRKRLSVDFDELVPREQLVLYEDKYDRTKFYLNHDTGFLVLKRVAPDRLLIITVVTHGRINNRESHIISKTRLFV